MKKALVMLTFVMAMASASVAQAAVVPITSITATGSSGPNPILLTSVTVGAYTVDAEDLRTGTGSGTYTGTGTPTYPVENADNFNINSFASEYDPHNIVDFGGSLFSDQNGDNPDFFIFENGGNDSGTIQAIFPDDTLGQAISFSTAVWGDTGYKSGVGNQAIKGMAFSITDLLDASGAALDNNSVIKGICIRSAGLDPSSISVVVPEPGSLLTLALGALALIHRKR